MNLAETIIRGIMLNCPEHSFSLRCTAWKYEPCEFAFYDFEEQKEHKVNLASLLVGYEKWRAFKARRNMLPCDGASDRLVDDFLCSLDAEDTDALIQFTIFGDIIYG